MVLESNLVMNVALQILCYFRFEENAFEINVFATGVKVKYLLIEKKRSDY